MNSESAAPLAPEPSSVSPAIAPGEPTSAREQPLALELSQFLQDLSIALHRYGMYPDGHPALQPALDRLARRAELLFRDRAHIAVGVARDRLVIEGVATDARNTVLQGLAERLHRHHLAVIEFARGLTRDELALIIKTVAEDPDRGGGPLGDRKGTSDQWPHVRLYPLTLDGVEMVDDPTPGTRTTAAQFAALWVGLARAALDRRGDAERGTLVTEPAVVARAIDEHQRVEAYDQVIVGYLLQIAEELRSARGAEAQELRRRTSMLVSAMQPETLRRLLDMGGDITQRGRFVTNAASGMAAGAVIDLLKAAAEASSETVSTRPRPALHEARRARGQRQHDNETARRFGAAGPGAQPAGRLEPRGSEPDRVPHHAAADVEDCCAHVADRGGVDEPLFEPLHVLQMALELDENSPGLWHALDALVAADGVG